MKLFLVFESAVFFWSSFFIIHNLKVHGKVRNKVVDERVEIWTFGGTKTLIFSWSPNVGGPVTQIVSDLNSHHISN